MALYLFKDKDTYHECTFIGSYGFISSFKSSSYTVLEPVHIEMDGGNLVYPELLADKLDFTSILFESAELNRRVKAIARNLPVAQHESLFAYLGRALRIFQWRILR